MRLYRSAVDENGTDGESGNDGLRTSSRYQDEVAHMMRVIIAEIGFDPLIHCVDCDLLPRCNREAPGPNGASYVEWEMDHQNSAALRAVMYDLGATGQLKNFPRARASSGGVLIEGGTNGSRGVLGLRKDVCEYWLSHGFGPEFWWSD